MGHCFVIQPFDGGKFDKRYRDVFAPAIQDAGLEPYRVDADPAVSIPIEDIENGIRKSDVCFADITLDNRNVWFELGYALAIGKEICLICSAERDGKFPFDVQHRAIIKYRVESVSDYADLRSKISQRIGALCQKAQNLYALSANSPIKEGHGLSQHEMMVLATIAENRAGPGSYVSHHMVSNDLERLGYNNLALNIGIEGLIRKDMVKSNYTTDRYNDKAYCVYEIQGAGVDWLINNSGVLNLGSSRKRRLKSVPEPTPEDADDIPF